MKLIAIKRHSFRAVLRVKRAAGDLPSSIQGFDASCFDGVYVTGDITAADIARMGAQRSAQDENDTDGSRLTLPNPATA